MGYNAGFYFEETYNRFLTGQSSLSFIRKGYADRGEESKRMEVNMDYFQFSFLPLFHMKEDTKNKLIAGIGFYIDILVNTKYKNTNEIFIRKYNNSGANIGMKAVLGIEIDKYISVAFQSQIDLNDNFKNVEGTTGSVYVGLNFMIPLFVIQHE